MSNSSFTIDASTLTASPTYTSPVYAGTSATTVYYDPIPVTQSIFPTYIDLEETKNKMKEYCEKTDEHVDKLEEDIDYLNANREAHGHLLNKLEAQFDSCIDKINTLTSTVSSLDSSVKYIMMELDCLKAKLDSLT